MRLRLLVAGLLLACSLAASAQDAPPPAPPQVKPTAPDAPAQPQEKPKPPDDGRPKPGESATPP